jgi:hypothetical protein
MVIGTFKSVYITEMGICIKKEIIYVGDYFVR